MQALQCIVDEYHSMPNDNKLTSLERLKETNTCRKIVIKNRK